MSGFIVDSLRAVCEGGAGCPLNPKSFRLRVLKVSFS